MYLMERLRGGGVHKNGSQNKHKKTRTLCFWFEDVTAEEPVSFLSLLVVVPLSHLQWCVLNLCCT